MNGCRLNLQGPQQDRLAWQGDLQFVSLFLAGDANIWDSWFFGAIRTLDHNYSAPFQRADFVVGTLSLRYDIADELAANYSFRQLVPVLVEVSSPSGGGGGSENAFFADSGVSGGNTQRLAVTYYF